MKKNEKVICRYCGAECYRQSDIHPDGRNDVWCCLNERCDETGGAPWMSEDEIKKHNLPYYFEEYDENGELIEKCDRCGEKVDWKKDWTRMEIDIKYIHPDTELHLKLCEKCCKKFFEWYSNKEKMKYFDDI